MHLIHYDHRNALGFMMRLPLFWTERIGQITALAVEDNSWKIGKLESYFGKVNSHLSGSNVHQLTRHTYRIYIKYTITLGKSRLHFDKQIPHSKVHISKCLIACVFQIIITNSPRYLMQMRLLLGTTLTKLHLLSEEKILRIINFQFYNEHAFFR